MPLIPFPVNEFGGLRLDVDPQELGTAGAVDLLNVSLSRNGRLLTRDGLSTFASPALGPLVGLGVHHPPAGATPQLLVAAATNISAFDSAGALLATKASIGVGGFVQLSTSAFAAATFMPAKTGSPQKWTGAAFANSTWPQQNERVAPTADSRIVYAGDPNSDTLYFSDAGKGDTFTATSFVALSPADGERFIEVVTWRELTFAFKQSKFYVFYGDSVLSDGTPVFNYRAVAGVGAADPGKFSNDPNTRVACAGRDGVYFLANDGVYVTTGGVPERLSKPLDPWFRNESIASLSAIPTNIGLADACIGVVSDRLYVCPNSSQSLTFVLDLLTGQWTAYNWAMTAITPWAVGNAIPVPLVAIGGVVYKHAPTATTDNGSAIAWSYTTGYSSAGGYFRQRIVSSGERKRHHHVDILGSGTVTHRVLTLNPRTADIADSGASVTLGTAPALARGYRRHGARGTHIAHKLSGSGPAVISGMTYWLTNVGSDT